MEHITPAVLAYDQPQLVHDLGRLLPWAPAIHLDYCDGQFVPSATVSVMDLLAVKIPQPREIHLMASNPLPYLEQAISAGVERIIVHCETMDDSQKFAPFAAHIIIAINPDTPITDLQVFPWCQEFMVMGIVPGKQGAPFDQQTPQRLADLRQLFPGVRLSVDGSVNHQTLPELVVAGADRCVVGSDLLKAAQPEQEYQQLTAYFVTQ